MGWGRGCMKANLRTTHLIRNHSISYLKHHFLSCILCSRGFLKMNSYQLTGSSFTKQCQSTYQETKMDWEIKTEYTEISRRAWQPIPVFLPVECPWTEEPSRLQSRGLQRVGHDWATKQSPHRDTAVPFTM